MLDIGSFHVSDILPPPSSHSEWKLFDKLDISVGDDEVIDFRSSSVVAAVESTGEPVRRGLTSSETCDCKEDVVPFLMEEEILDSSIDRMFNLGINCSFRKLFSMLAILFAQFHDFPVSVKYWMQRSTCEREWLRDTCASREPDVAWTADRMKIVPAEKTTWTQVIDT